MAAIIAVVLVALLVQDVPLAGYLREVEEERIVTALERDAFVLAGRSEEALHDEVQPDADGTISELVQAYRAESGARVMIVDRDGVAVITSDEDALSVGESYLSRPEIARALSGQVAAGTRFSTTLDEDLLYVAVPVISGSDIFGAVRLTYPKAVVTDAVNQKLLVIGLVGLTTVLLAGLIGFILARSFTRPVRRLRTATEEFAAGDRDARADEASGPPELRSLGRSFNGMATRLNGLLDQQRAFAGDASHQLRTPLTALRLRIERARELAPTDPAAAVERLEAADAELGRLEELIEGLLVLSRAEGSTAAREPTDAARIASERVEQWNDLAAESGRRVVYEGPASAVVHAVPGALEQIVDNLVDNALGASPADARVVVRLEATADATVLHVLDRGSGMSGADRAHAFERFWRASGTERAGSGLGLAIVAQLARACGADARLDARDGGGTDAVVVFETGGRAPATTLTK